MTKKYCINCTFLYHHENGSPVSCTENDRSSKNSEWQGIGVGCFHKQWMTNWADDLIRYMKYKKNPPDSGFPFVMDRNGNQLNLSSYSCKLHHPFDVNSSKPLERVWQEEQCWIRQRNFWLTWGVVLVSALAAFWGIL